MMTDAACNKSHAYLDSLNHGYGTIHIPRLATVSVACIGVCGIKIINKVSLRQPFMADIGSALIRYVLERSRVDWTS